MIGRLAIAVSLAACLAGCRTSRSASSSAYEVAPVSFRELAETVSKDEPDIDLFKAKGPFAYTVKRNQVIKIRTGKRRVTIVYDLAVPANEAKAPLVILSHGNMSRKEAHRYQIEHLASYGMYAMAVQLPNRDKWMDNGVALGKLVKGLGARPAAVHASIDPEAIILGGHSFGGSAVALAAARGAPVKGLILLDPALFKPSLEDDLAKIDAPVMVLGADRKIFKARKRRSFFQGVSGEAAEISIKGATHDDAQFPSMFAVAGVGIDPFTTKSRQELFAAAIAASAFSLATTGSVEYAYDALKDLKDVKYPKMREAKNATPDEAEQAE